MRLKYSAVVFTIASLILFHQVDNKNSDDFLNNFKTIFQSKINLVAQTSLSLKKGTSHPSYLHGERSIICPADSSNPRNTCADITKLSDNRLLLGYTKYSGGGDDWNESIIEGKISNDCGKTWDSSFTIQKNIGRLNVMNPSFLRLNNGELWLFFLVWNSSADCKLYYKKSTNEGITWSIPEMISNRDGYNIVTNCNVIQLSNGRIIAPISHMKTFADNFSLHKVSCVFSDDTGKTWKYSTNTLSFQASPALEPVVIELGKGKILMYIRTMLQQIYYSVSTNFGTTWTIPMPSGLPSGSAPACIKRLSKTKDLLIVWSPIPYSPAKPYDRSLLTCAISTDAGVTWKKKKIIENNEKYEFSYPSITVIDDSVYLTYYMGELTSKKISLILNVVDLKNFYTK